MREFKFLDLNENDCISKMKKSDLLEFLKCVKDFKPIYRENLGIDNKFKFGLEIEYEDSFDRDEVDEYIRDKFPSWSHDEDGSLSDDGGEVISPILTDTKENWKDVRKICYDLKMKFGASANENCGAHIHSAADYLENNENLIKFIKLWISYENIAYRFGYGDKTFPRSAINSYAMPVSMIWKKLDLDNFYNYPLAKIVAQLLYGENYEYGNVDSKSLGVNLYNTKTLSKNVLGNTCEYRFFNGTLNSGTWQNNVDFIYHMIKYAKNNEFDFDKIEKRRIENVEKIGKINYCNDIDLYGAIGLADLIYNVNEDKVYFLNQYIKKDEKVDLSNICIKK